MVTGVSGEKTRITLGANWYDRKAIYARDRGYSEVPPFLSGNSSHFKAPGSVGRSTCRGTPQAAHSPSVRRCAFHDTQSDDAPGPTSLLDLTFGPE